MRALFFAFAVVLGACGPSAPDSVVNGIVVITQDSPSTDFKALRTFALPTQVKLVAQAPPGPKDWTADVPNLLSAVEANLVAKGYAKHSGTATSADFGVTVSAILGTEEEYFTGVWCDYCFWYPGTPYCGAQCSWDFSYIGDYRYGTLIIELHEFTTPPPDAGARVKTHWSAALYSVLPDTGYDAAKAKEAIDRAFSQSPRVAR
ncbi:MAG: hypothetical protein AMXMBFR34_01890 [Myxococcaceae bacterium]